MFGQKVALGAALIGLFQLLAKFMDLIATIILARLLLPEDFGLVAIAVAVLLITNSITELPVVDVLVQREELDHRDIDTAFTLTFLRGLLVAGVTASLAYPVAQFYTDDRLIPIMLVLALVPIAQGLNSPAMIHFMRQIKYGPTARAALIGKGCGVVTTILLALAGASYWALIANLVVTPIGVMLTTHIMAPYRPRFRTQGARAILSFAGWVTVSRIIWTLNMQADRFLIGRILGKSTLGQYAMGGDISSMATYAVAGPILQPIFSGFSRIQGDMARMRAAYIKSQQTLIMLVLPLGVGLAAVANNLIPVLLGAGWEQTIPVIQWLAPVIALQMMSVPVQSAAMALARPKALAWRELLGLLLRLPATLVAAWYWGLIGAVVARSLTGLVIILLNLTIARGLVGVPLRRQLLAGWRSYCSALLMVGVVWGLDRIIGHDALPMPALIAGQIFFGGLTYVGSHMALWFCAKRPGGSEQFLLDLVRSRGKKAGAPASPDQMNGAN